MSWRAVMNLQVYQLLLVSSALILVPTTTQHHKIDAFSPHLTHDTSKEWPDRNACFPSSLVLRGGSTNVDDIDASPLQSMLQASQLVYIFVKLRNIVLEHESTFNLDLTEKQKKKQNIVDFDTPALIVTKNSAGNVFKKTKLKHEITCAAILKFIQLNRKFLQVEDGDITFDKDGTNSKELAIEKKLEKLQENFDADVVEYDDFNAKKELLYSIVVNRTHKRIVVVFRGSTTTKDWLVDANFGRANPDEVKASAKERKVKIHKGFSNYLFGKAKEDNDESKFESICNVLEEVYAYKSQVGAGRDYSDYDLFVTGHSLGGALAQLLSYAIAGSKKATFLPEGKPVTAMTYASPEVGDDVYLDTFNELEEEGKLRHLRVSNHGDAVPIVFNTLMPFLRYTQPGVNIHVHPDKGAEVNYNEIKKFWINPLKAGGMHSLDVYAERIFGIKENSDIISNSVEDFYSNFLN